MISIGKVLFPVDFSDRCRGTAHAVRATAGRFQAEVTALHIIEADPVDESLSNQVHDAMDRLMAEDLSGCKVTPCIVSGDPATRIVEHAHNGHIDLVMMPAHGHGTFRRFLLGAVTAKVLHDAQCPVWTSTHLESWPAVENISLRTLLCGVDFGPQSIAALKCASQVAAEFHAKLIVAHAIPIIEAFERPATWRNKIMRAAEERVHAVERKLEISAKVEILEGSPASALCEMAEHMDADLIVIGRTHISTDSGKLGANAYAIIAHSPCPVLSV